MLTINLSVLITFWLSWESYACALGTCQADMRDDSAALLQTIALRSSIGTLDGTPLVVIPGLGDIERAKIVRSNLDLLAEAFGSDFKCHLTIWAPDAANNSAWNQSNFAPCHMEYDVDGAGIMTPIKFLMNDTQHFSGHTGDVLLLMDDMILKRNTVHLLQSLRKHVDVASAALSRDWCLMMWQHDGPQHARSTTYLDFAVQLFSNDAFRCLQKYTNLEVNSMGYGLAGVYGSVCATHPMAICDLDDCTVKHADGHWGKEKSVKATVQMHDYFNWLQAEGAQYDMVQCDSMNASSDSTKPLEIRLL